MKRAENLRHTFVQQRIVFDELWGISKYGQTQSSVIDISSQSICLLNQFLPWWYGSVVLLVVT